MKRKIFVVISVLFLTVCLCGLTIAKDLAAGSKVTITGTINADNQLVDVEGQAFDLANTGKGMEVKAMIGKKIQIKGTVLENEGQKTVRISDYKIIKE